MTHIEAAEESLARANWLYVMAWSFAIVTGFAVFLDVLAVSREEKSVEAQLKAFEGVADTALEVAAALRAELAVQYPGADSEGSALDRLVADSLRYRRFLSQTYRELSDSPSVPMGASLRRAVNASYVMTLFNQGGGGIVEVPGEPSLLLAEYPLGYIRSAANVERLTLEDLSKLLWMASLRPHNWNRIQGIARSDSLSGGENVGVEGVVSTLQLHLNEPLMQQHRKSAKELWVDWIQLAREFERDAERQEVIDITLEDLRIRYTDTLHRLAELRLREEGYSKVTLPVVETTVSVRDAVFALPAIFSISMIGIAIHLSQVIRYIWSTQQRESELAVGGLPTFVWRGWTAPLGAIILFGPYVVFGALVILAPNVVPPDREKEFWMFAAASVIFAVPAVVQNWRLQRLLGCQELQSTNQTGSTPTSQGPCD